jgi:DNA-binding NtrC family response regulator
MAERILIVEDEDTLRESLCRVFEREGYEVAGVSSAEAALEHFDEAAFDLVITDIILPGITGIELIKRIKEAAPDQAAIVMTAYASMETAVETLRAGAYDYIVKPIIHEEIKQTVRNALRLRALQLENEMLKEEAADQYDTNRIIGNHPEMEALRNRLKKVADAQSPVLIRGELGTGKKLIARAIQLSGRRPRFPFLEVHCTSLTSEQKEEELFRPKGTLHRVQNGTLYLNRVESLSEKCQRRFLGILEDGQLRFAGYGNSHKFDALVISGAEKDLEVLVSEGKFLEPLYQRLFVVKIALPPLRERGNDLEALADFFLARYSRTFSKNVRGLSDEAKQRLKSYSWPGNVLELRNVLERAVLMTKNEHLMVEDFPPLS